MWLPGAAADGSERVLVGLCVSAEVFLDAHENWGECSRVGEDEALQGARHSAVAVAEWVDHDQVEVCHCGLDEGRTVGGLVEPLHEFVDEGGNLVDVCALVDDFGLWRRF